MPSGKLASGGYSLNVHVVVKGCGREKMARLGCVYFQFFVICTSLSSLVDSIELNKGTSRPRLRSTVAPPGGASTSTTTKSPKADSGIAIYRLINRNTDTTCILLKTDALVEVKFKLHEMDTQADSFIPEHPLVVGECGGEDYATMNLVWSGYSLTLSFSKTPGGEHWYISKVELTVSVDISQFHGIKTRDKTLRLYNTTGVTPTPVGKSYVCDEEVSVILKTDPADRPPKGVHGALLLRALQVQAFMYKSENFSTAFECKSQRSFRSETAPIAVGSTLAIAALATVTGYGVFRYFKVKNVQYNTME